jgi:hypothetical protein
VGEAISYRLPPLCLHQRLTGADDPGHPPGQEEEQQRPWNELTVSGKRTLAAATGDQGGHVCSRPSSTAGVTLAADGCEGFKLGRLGAGGPSHACVLRVLVVGYCTCYRVCMYMWHCYTHKECIHMDLQTLYMHTVYKNTDMYVCVAHTHTNTSGCTYHTRICTCRAHTRLCTLIGKVSLHVTLRL